jgi:hypothetical protein
MLATVRRAQWRWWRAHGGDRTRRSARPEIVAKCAEINTGTAGPAWSIVDDVVLFQGRIFLPPSSDYWAPVLEQVHGMDHEGVQKTLQWLRASFFMVHDNKLVREFIKGCYVCRRHKTEHLHPVGLLLPLDVSSSVWTDIQWTSSKDSLRWGASP